MRAVWRRSYLQLAVVVACASAVLAASLLVFGVVGGTSRANTPCRLHAGFVKGHFVAPRLAECAHSASARRDAKAVEARRAWLASDAERARRRASATAYHGLTRARSASLMMRDFGARVRPENPALAVAHAGRVTRYVGDFAALVHTPNRSVKLVRSTVPLRASQHGKPLRPVDLSMRASADAFVAANPLESVSVSKRLSGGVAVGPNDIRVVPAGKEVAGTAIGNQGVFFGGSGADEDVSIAPRITGAEISTILRSRSSPEQLVYKLSLPAGAFLAQDGAGAKVTRAGRVIAQVPAPNAVDAENSFVPVKMRVSGDELALTVAHRSMDVAYPLLVDPRIVTYKVERSSPGWRLSSCEDEASCGGTPLDAPEGGVLTAPPHNYGHGEIKQWQPGEEACQQRKVRFPEKGLVYCYSVYSELWDSPYSEWRWLGPGRKHRRVPNFSEINYEGVSVTPGEMPSNAVEAGEEEGPFGTGWWEYSVGCYHSTNLAEAPPTVITDESSDPPVPNCPWPSISLGLRRPPQQFVLWGSTSASPEGGTFSTRVGPTSVATTLSIEALVVVEGRLPHRRRGVRKRELLGSGNPGEPNLPYSCSDDPVNCATGNLTESQTDLSVPGRGVGLTLGRTYNSQAAVDQGQPGPFGYGWSWSFGANLKVSNDYRESEHTETRTVEQANGSTVVFAGAEGQTQPGVQSSLSYDSEHHQEVYTLPNQQSLRFGSGGRLTSETDRNGNVTSVTEACEGGESAAEGGEGAASANLHRPGSSGEGRMEYAAFLQVSGEGEEPSCRIEVTDPAGRKLTLHVNSEGLVDQATDPMGHTVSYAYENGDLSTVTEPGESAPRWRFHYDSQHRMTSMTDGRGATTTNTYDGSNRVIEQTDVRGDVHHFEYNEDGGSYLEGVGLGSIGAETAEEESWPEVGEEEEEEIAAGVAGVVLGGGGGGEEPPPATSAPPTLKTRLTDTGTGAVTEEQFSAQYELTSITNGAGSEDATNRTFEYDDAGNLTAENDGNDHTTHYGYDAAGNRTSETDPLGHKTEWEFDSSRDVVGVTTPSGEKTTVDRDSDGNAIEVARPAPGGETQVTKYAYTAFGELRQTTDPKGDDWHYEYDAFGDRIAEISPEDEKRTFTYNRDSQEISTTSPRGNTAGGEPARYTTIIERDAQGRVARVIEPLE
jgi:YD repeat-containing protein